jgi:hypothetical protein
LGKSLEDLAGSWGNLGASWGVWGKLEGEIF